MSNEYHIPALLDETIEALCIVPCGTYVDATFGGGGHSRAIFNRLSNGKLIAFDQDADAVLNSWESDNFILIRSNFSKIKNFIEYLDIAGVDGIVADLGLSTHHINVPERGFSFRFNARLDMRMNTSQSVDAQQVINEYSDKELAKILYDYGNIANARKIATKIYDLRKKKEIVTTFDLIDAIKEFTPLNNTHKFLAKVFQAIRIEVNDEITNLKEFLARSVDILKVGGKLAVISYHSLEDKIIKNFFRTGNFTGERITDMYGNLITSIRATNKKVIKPSLEEISINNRVRSAKLRIAEKI